MNERRLGPWRGFFSPGIYFSSGHCLWLYNWESTPVGPYTQAWVISPDEKRTLYVDPLEAGQTVCLFHEFDNVVGSDLTWGWSGSQALSVHMTATDETVLDLSITLSTPLAAKLLNGMIKSSPRPLAKTAPMLAVSQASLDILLGTNPLKITGSTETGKRYRSDADRLAVVAEASATLNGEDLGALTRPEREFSFGDAKTPNRPIFVFGTLNLEYPDS